ncbi:MAG: multicopper oxidase domain-containing protein [Chloroflexota bacterium]
MSNDVSRREFFRASALTALAATGAVAIAKQAEQVYAAPPLHPGHDLGIPTVVGEVNHTRNGFNPSTMITEFEYGETSELITGQTLRTFNIKAEDKTLEIAPGLEFPAWTYNGRVPGPALRCKAGERVRVNFTNAGTHPHSMHFRGIHPPEMDGVPGSGFGLVQPGQSTFYEFDAEPFGLHLYHSHSYPLAQNMVRGLYGVFIVEPEDGWPMVDHEMVLVLNGFDVNFDQQNNFYAFNTIPFHYQKLATKLKLDAKNRLFLVNMMEYETLTSFHLHGNFFHYYPSGTSLVPSEYTDTIALMQAQRGILEFSYKFPGLYLFRAQQARQAELGAIGLFQVDI